MGKGYQEAKKLIAQLRAKTYRKLNDDELLEFRKEMIDHMGGVLKETVSEGLFSSGLDKKGIEDLVDKLKVQFQIAYETGLESPGSYDDFDREFWNSQKRDLIYAFEKALK
jgi:hypothetical protein